MGDHYPSATGTAAARGVPRASSARCQASAFAAVAQADPARRRGAVDARPALLPRLVERPRADRAVARGHPPRRLSSTIASSAAAMVTRGKPAPDLFLARRREHGRGGPARTLVVEDSVDGVRAGKAAGMTVWGFVGGSHYARARRRRAARSGRGRSHLRRRWPSSCRRLSQSDGRESRRSRGSTTRRAPAGSISSPATPRTRSPASSTSRARRRSGWSRWRSRSG